MEPHFSTPEIRQGMEAAITKAEVLDQVLIKLRTLRGSPEGELVKQELIEDVKDTLSTFANELEDLFYGYEMRIKKIEDDLA